MVAQRESALAATICGLVLGTFAGNIPASLGYAIFWIPYESAAAAGNYRCVAGRVYLRHVAIWLACRVVRSIYSAVRRTGKITLSPPMDGISAEYSLVCCDAPTSRRTSHRDHSRIIVVSISPRWASPASAHNCPSPGWADAPSLEGFMSPMDCHAGMCRLACCWLTSWRRCHHYCEVE